MQLFVLPRYEGTVWDDVAHGKGVYVAEDGLVRCVYLFQFVIFRGKSENALSVKIM